MTAARGFSLAELLVAMAVGAGIAAVALPAAAHLREGGRAAAGARLVAEAFSDQRWRAVGRRVHHGVLFERPAGRWGWREVRDGNGNGLRTAEVRDGTDPTLAPFRDLESWVPGVRLGIPPGGPYPEAPPGTGTLTENDAPVRFGSTTLVSFSPLGRASSGTLYVTDGHDGLFAVVLFGPSARTRVWRWDGRARQWKP